MDKNEWVDRMRTLKKVEAKIDQYEAGLIEGMESLPYPVRQVVGSWIQVQAKRNMERFRERYHSLDMPDAEKDHDKKLHKLLRKKIMTDLAVYAFNVMLIRMETKELNEEE